MIKRLELGRELIASLSHRTIQESLALDAWPTDPPGQLHHDIANIREQIVTNLRSDPGAVVVGMSAATLGDVDLCAVAWNLFTCVARPVPQYITGELIYPVEVSDNAEVPDHAAKVSHYSRSSRTGGFHTDGTLLSRPPGIAALVCISQASSGGETVLIDGRAVCRELKTATPDAITVLSAPHHFDVMGQIAGLETKEQPILDWSGRHVQVRYLRQYIEDGYVRVAKPIPAELVLAMDALDAATMREQYQTEILLGRGQLLIWDNNRFLHGRRAFNENGSKRRLRRIYGVVRSESGDARAPLKDGLLPNEHP